jgi:hypothetical protein
MLVYLSDKDTNVRSLTFEVRCSKFEVWHLVFEVLLNAYSFKFEFLFDLRLPLVALTLAILHLIKASSKSKACELAVPYPVGRRLR